MPQLVVKVSSTVKRASINEDDLGVVCLTWTDWLQWAQSNHIELIDANFDWCEYERRAAEFAFHHVCVLSLENGEILGLLYFQEPYSDKELQAFYMSVRPDCRHVYSPRYAERVGEAMLVFLCNQSCDFNPDRPLHLNAVLPESVSFFKKYGAQFEYTDNNGDDHYKVPFEQCQALISRFP